MSQTWIVTMGAPATHAHAGQAHAGQAHAGQEWGPLRAYHPPPARASHTWARGHSKPYLTGQQSYQCGWSTLALVLAGLAGVALGGYLGFSIASAAQAGTAFGLWVLGAQKSMQKFGEGIALRGGK